MIVAMSSFILFAQLGSVGSVQFSVSASPETVFVRQQVSYDASLRIRELSPPRFLATPQYTPSDITGVEVYNIPFDTVRSIQHVTVSGVRFTQYTYRSAIFPLTAGIDTIPSPTLTYTLLNDADPYASRSTTVHGAQQHIVVLPLPSRGKPAGFSDAVGQFTLSVVADRQGLHTGNAFNVRATVTGTGDIALLQRPALAIPWATVVNTSDSVMWDSPVSTGILMHGFKEFRWLVTPQSGGHLTIPPTRYSYFNPTTKTYETAVAAAIPVTIAGDSVALPTHDSLSSTPFSGLMHTFIHALRQRLVLLLGILAGVCVLAGVIVWGAARRHQSHHRTHNS